MLQWKYLTRCCHYSLHNIPTFPSPRNECFLTSIFPFEKKLEDRSQKKKIMFLHSKNKASGKGYKGEC